MNSEKLKMYMKDNHHVEGTRYTYKQTTQMMEDYHESRLNISEEEIEAPYESDEEADFINEIYNKVRECVLWHKGEDGAQGAAEILYGCRKYLRRKMDFIKT